MQVSEFLPNLLKTCTTQRDYAKSFAFYLDRKTAIARELTEYMLTVFKTGTLYSEDGSVDTDLLPNDFWYTPIKATISAGYTTANRTHVYIHALELAKSLCGLIDQGESTLYDVIVAQDPNDYVFTLKNIVKDLDADAYDILEHKLEGSVVVNLPFPCFVGDSTDAVSSITISASSDASITIARTPDSCKSIHIDVMDTLKSMVDSSHKVTLQSAVLLELGNSADSLSIADLTSKIKLIAGSSADSVLQSSPELVNLAVDNSSDVDTRISNVIRAIVPDLTVTDGISESLSDDPELYSIITSDAYSGTDVSAMWDTANCSTVFSTAFGIVANVVAAAGKLVISALKGLFNIGCRLWKKYVEPAYSAKDFVKSEHSTNESYCDIPLLYFGDSAPSDQAIPFSTSKLAFMVKSKYSEQSSKVFNLYDDTATFDFRGVSAPAISAHYSHGTLFSTSCSISPSTAYQSVKFRTRRLLLDSYGSYFSNQPDLDAHYADYSVSSSMGCIIKDGNGTEVYRSVPADMALPGSGSTASAYFGTNAGDSLSATWTGSSAWRNSFGIVTYTQSAFGQPHTEIGLVCGSSFGSKSSSVRFTFPYAITSITLDENNLSKIYNLENDFDRLYLKISDQSSNTWFNSCTDGSPGQFSYTTVLFGDKVTDAAVSYAAGYITVSFKGGHRARFRIMVKPSSIVVSLNMFHVSCAGELICVYSEGSAYLAKPSISEPTSLDKLSICLPGDNCVMSRQLNFTCSNITAAVLVPVYEVTVPISGVSADDSIIYDPMDNVICHWFYEASQVRFDNSKVGQGSDNIPCGVNSDSPWFTGDSGDINCLCYDVDSDFRVSMRDPMGALPLASVYVDVSFITRLGPADNYTKHVSVPWSGLSKLPDKTVSYYDTADGPIINYQWSENCNVLQWFGLPISSLNDNEVQALLNDIVSPIDVGCACVTRFTCGAVQIIQSKDSGLVGTVYASPINYKEFFLDDGSPRFRVSTDGIYSITSYATDDASSVESMEVDVSSFLQSFLDHITAAVGQPSGDYSLGDEGDVSAYRDMFAGKWLMDLLMFATANPQANVSDLFSTGGTVKWHMFNEASFILSEVSNKSFYNLLLGGGVSDASEIESWMYAHLFAIVSNKPAYMRIYYKLFGQAPDFYPYLIGDRLGMPKWHISTDNDIQSYIDKVCAAVVIAIAIIAAVILIGVASVKITKALKMRVNSAAASEATAKANHGKYLAAKNSAVKQRADLKKKMKSMDPSSSDYAEAKSKLASLDGAIASANEHIKASSKALLKAQKSTKRWTKLSSAFGVAPSSSDIVREAFADEDPSDYQSSTVIDNDSLSDTVIDEVDDVNNEVKRLHANLSDITSGLSDVETAVNGLTFDYPELDLSSVLGAISTLKDSIANQSRNGPLDM